LLPKETFSIDGKRLSKNTPYNDMKIFLGEFVSHMGLCYRIGMLHTAYLMLLIN